MLNTLGNIESGTRLGRGRIGGGVDSRNGRAKSEIDNRKKIDGGEFDGGEVEDDKVGKKVQKTFKSKNLSKSKNMIRIDFLTPRAKLAFIKLRQAFFKAPIFHYFDPEHYIRIETNASGYAINVVLY